MTAASLRLLLASFLSVSSLVAVAAESAGTLSKPFLPVIAKIDITASRAKDKTLSLPEIDALANNYAGLELWPSLLASAVQVSQLKAKNPDFLILPYLNSSNGPANWLGKLEQDRLNTISVYREASLAVAVGSGDTVLKATPADTTRGLRIKASTVAGEKSRDSKAYVSFVRIDDELMRVESVDPQAGSITVTRGFSGSKAASHTAGAPVLAPVYVGSTGEWSGIPDRSPGPVRYAMRIDNDEVLRLLADQVIQYMAKGASGAWLDICSPSFYNLANAYGEPVKPWNLAVNAEYTPTTRKVVQDLKLNRLQTLVHDANGTWPVLTANNVGGGEYFEEGGGAMDFLRPTENKPRPIRAVVLEAAFSYHVRNQFARVPVWKVNLSTIIHGAQNGLPVWPWLKSYPDAPRPQTEEAQRMALYDYASVLLGWEFGSGGAIVTEAFADDGHGARTIYLPRFWFYDLGKPVERAPYDNVDRLRPPDHESYVRRWTGGIVLVNPTPKADRAIELESGYFDPETGEAVQHIQLGARQAAILLRHSAN